MLGFRKKPAIEPAPRIEPQLKGLFSTHGETPYARNLPYQLRSLPVPTVLPQEQTGMDDSAYDGQGQVSPFKSNFGCSIPELQLAWYDSQGFIGYQTCALLMQHWLIDKACRMPGRDAVRKGWELTVNGGDNVPGNVLNFISKIDKAYKVKWHLHEYLFKGRGFGIRVALFKVESPDPKYYEKPFNIDGVTPGSYKGIVQIDPYWIVPELTFSNVQDPTGLHFYEAEYWRTSSGLIHRSHLMIFTTGQVPDVLKPAYYYGGVSVPQRIMERIYAAERTANEAPMLAMTKRLTVMKTDLEQAMSNPSKFAERMEWWKQTRDNHGVKINGLDDEIQQFDTSLAELDNVIMTQYQIVAAIAEVPGTKLMGTQPKGFNSTGEFEEASYHEFLETLQEDDLSPLLDRHYALVVKSFVMPKFGMSEFQIDAAWRELDAMTALEQAQLNLLKIQGDAAAIATGEIDAQEGRKRLITDKDSGYNGLPEELPPMPDEAPVPGQPGAAPAQAAGTRAAAQLVAGKPSLPRARPEPGA